MPQKTDIAVVILAGGKSSRMGRDKALLNYKGKSLVDHITNIIKEAGFNDVYISGDINGYQNIADIFPGNGPVGGIYSSIKKLSNLYNNILFIPVDMPMLSKEFIRFFVEKANGNEICYFDNHPLPLMIHINANIKKYTQTLNFINKEKHSVRRYINNFDAKPISIPERYLHNLTNTNTPEEWLEATA